MAKERVDRLNSLLKEVLSEVIRRDVQNRNIPDLVTVTRVDITKDLRHAKVYISMIGTEDNFQHFLFGVGSLLEEALYRNFLRLLGNLFLSEHPLF